MIQLAEIAVQRIESAAHDAGRGIILLNSGANEGNGRSRIALLEFYYGNGNRKIGDIHMLYFQKIEVFFSEYLINGVEGCACDRTAALGVGIAAARIAGAGFCIAGEIHIYFEGAVFLAGIDAGEEQTDLFCRGSVGIAAVSGFGYMNKRIFGQLSDTDDAMIDLDAIGGKQSRLNIAGDLLRAALDGRAGLPYQGCAG